MIIESLLDTDLYKFTMMQCVLHQFPGLQAEYRFKCRNENVDLRPILPQLREEIRSLCTLQFTPAELDFLRRLRFMKSDFIDFLGLFRLNEKYVTVREDASRGGGIDISIKGPWLHTILFEIPLLAIVSELYFRHTCPMPDWHEGARRLEEKIRLILAEENNEGLSISDYGTRRRFSRDWQEKVLLTMRDGLGVHFAGTSNCLFAMRHGMLPLGTMAHEYMQACQAAGPRLRDSQSYAFEMWAREYRGDLGIALSDVYGIDPFLRDFDMYFCKLFDGARQDSGDPMAWGEKMIEHYKRNKVDPRNKTLVFSDSLNIPRLLDIYRRFNGRVRLGFGVGTNLMNDLGPEPLNIVIKMVRANGQPVAKISDTPGKGMCEDPGYLAYLKSVFGIPA